jgi:PAS domain S-box-containing protein
MVRRLSRLPESTQSALQQLACLGVSTEFDLLRKVYDDEEIHARLFHAVRAGLIIPTKNSYKFLHDRVQEAAYSTIPKAMRAETHLRIGKLLAEQTPTELIEDAIFEIVNQLNRGIDLIVSRSERLSVSQLNFIAGRRAKGSTAYISALAFLETSRALLSKESWDANYERIFSIERETAECELLTAQMQSAETRLTMLAESARSPHDAATIARLRLMLYTTLDRSDRSVEVCLEYMRRNGTDWTARPTNDEVRREYAQIWQRLDRRRVEDLIDLPLAQRQDVLDILDVLAEAVTPALFCDENLSSLIICRMVNLSLEYGNSDGSCFAYVWFAIIAGPRFGNYPATSKFGQLGYNLVELRGLRRYQARTYMSYGDIVIPWKSHVRSGRDLVRRAFDAANQIGDLTFAAYSCNHLVTNMLAAGDRLSDVEREAKYGLEFAQKTRFGLVTDHIRVQLALIASLRGATTEFGCFNDGQFNEAKFEGYLANNTALAELECWYYVRKIQIRFLAGNQIAAIAASLKARKLLWTSPSQFETAEYHFYSALARAAAWTAAPPTQRSEYFGAVIDHHKQLKIWSENCPENFENRAWLVEAEIARIEGRDLDAMRLYQSAIRSADENGFAHNTAIAYEVASKFYSNRGFDKIALVYLREAREAYLRWGADAKVRCLDRETFWLSGGTRTSEDTIVASIDQFDIATAMDVSQALAGEFQLEKLVDKLMRTAVEYAGAERGVLIILREEGPRVEAEVTTEADCVKVTLRHGDVALADLAHSVVHYVIRTKECVLLHDAVNSTQFASDGYIRRNHVRSIYCNPLLKQGQLVGALYLENRLATRVFTPPRISMLKLLASQAAMSLDNIRLYGDLREREAKVRKLVEAALDAVLTIDGAEQITEWNTRAETIFGWRRDEVLGKRLSDLIIPARFKSEHREGLRRFLVTGDGPLLNRPIETMAVRRNGDEFPIELSVAAYRIGEAWFFSGFIRDMTERKRGEAALRETEAELTRVSRLTAMGELVASIAHEIRQPIASVITNASAALRWMERDKFDVSELKDAFTRIAATGKHASDVVASLRTLAQQRMPRFADIAIDDIVREVLLLARGDFERQQIDVELELASHQRLVSGDKVQLQQVILNLARNAIDAMGVVTDRPRVLTITSCVAGDDVVIGVADTGSGIDAEILDRIFESFFTTKSDGIGIGLSICRSIITNHKGRIWAASRLPHGAEFKIALPSLPKLDPGAEVFSMHTHGFV